MTEKAEFPVSKVRRYLEPGPIVLLSSAHRGQRDIMALGWHTMMEFTPALVGCVIAADNHSFELVRGSGECVLNLPTAAMIDTVVGIGNTSGMEVDKFEHFGLTAGRGVNVDAPLIRDCPVNLECRLADASLVERYNFFIFQVMRAHAVPQPEHHETLHYTGDGVFMVAGGTVSRREQFRPELLD
ncbi:MULTISPECIES: flavin reductase family protein [Nitrospirillum]|uniref:Flavin reductase (DIM6/NTAB) family NADH-FMN oxidoreductase RutF n=1 Tax=Nitrospirillum amazonense TaxID=28077 RepID=A0A560FBC3_9PROT|nr:flavin reductase family protein [Nitrospirillum amazonense]MEC4593216.1 flavin reductase family protein [Nitrospirillum amazonense]TWB18917.1 flavin reductase (DIM6/NTAB) family NADH-FMN oxidoreductase RutF [Nitrospirillum amazonense]